MGGGDLCRRKDCSTWQTLNQDDIVGQSLGTRLHFVCTPSRSRLLQVAAGGYVAACGVRDDDEGVVCRRNDGSYDYRLPGNYV